MSLLGSSGLACIFLKLQMTFGRTTSQGWSKNDHFCTPPFVGWFHETERLGPDSASVASRMRWMFSKIICETKRLLYLEIIRLHSAQRRLLLILLNWTSGSSHRRRATQADDFKLLPSIDPHPAFWLIISSSLEDVCFWSPRLLCGLSCLYGSISMLLLFWLSQLCQYREDNFLAAPVGSSQIKKKEKM